MGTHAEFKPGFSEFLEENGSVVGVSELLNWATRGAIRWQIGSGRWQEPCRGVVVTHSGDLTSDQVLRVVLMHTGPRAVLAGLTAARLDGLAWSGDKEPASERPIYVLAPPGYPRRPAPLGLNVIMHYSRQLTGADVHPTRVPKRTRLPRSLLNAAAWHATDRGALAILASGVQQRLTRVDLLNEALGRISHTLPRRELIIQALVDIEGGAQALSELDFTRLVVRRFDLPEPSRQAGRRDERGRRRWIDVVWEDWKVAVEIDGSQHIEASQYWDDMDRENDLKLDGYLVLRFPAWAVRRHPERVARKILQALRKAGYKG